MNLTCGSLIKLAAVGKTALILLVSFIATDSQARDIASETRQCIRKATSAVAILACEREAHGHWQVEVARRHQALLPHLSGKAKGEYEKAHAAWEDFRTAEFALIDLTLGARSDGLAGPLAEGAKVQVLQRRAEQLAEHLHAIVNAHTQ